MTDMERQSQLEDIVVNRCITPVFQPIISLRDGSVLGFEALSRVERPGVFDNVEQDMQDLTVFAVCHRAGLLSG